MKIVLKGRIEGTKKPINLEIDEKELGRLTELVLRKAEETRKKELEPFFKCNPDEKDLIATIEV